VAALVLHLRRTARHAVNVLLAAVAQSPACRGVPVRLACGPAAVGDAARAARAEGRTPVIAWSFFTASFPEVAAELAEVRALLAGVGAVQVAGGPHPSGDPEGTLRAGFDLAAIGEGEATLPALLARVAAGEDPRAVPGLAWLEDGALRTSGRAAPVDLDAVPACAVDPPRLNPVEIRPRTVEAAAGHRMQAFRGGRRRRARLRPKGDRRGLIHVKREIHPSGKLPDDTRGCSEEEVGT
jgi:radical SAM superfamily enzyme YgiQ (UPF0313 family)